VEKTTWESIEDISGQRERRIDASNDGRLHRPDISRYAYDASVRPSLFCKPAKYASEREVRMALRCPPMSAAPASTSKFRHCFDLHKSSPTAERP
jgi:hypothetical protein